MVVAPDEVIPTTLAAVLDNVLIMLLLILTTVAGEAEDNAVTVPPVPLDTRLVIVLPLAVTEVAAPELPITIPLIAAWPAILFIVFELKVVTPPLKLRFITVIPLVPPVHEVKVLLLIFLVGVPPSVFDQPAIVVAPVTVRFEKLFPVWVIIAPVTEDALETNKLTVPPAPVLLYAVTIELLFTVCVPAAGTDDVFVINVTLPVVLTTMFVNVLLLIFWDSVVAELER